MLWILAFKLSTCMIFFKTIKRILLAFSDSQAPSWRTKVRNQALILYVKKWLSVNVCLLIANYVATHLLNARRDVGPIPCLHNYALGKNVKSSSDFFFKKKKAYW